MNNLTATSIKSARWRGLLAPLALASVLAAASAPAHAQQAYPNRPISLIVLLAPGGITDVAARAIAAAMTTELGQQVVVDNKPGGGGVIGTNHVAKSQPNGYTVCYCISAQFTLMPAMGRAMPFKPEDLEPVVKLYDVDLFIVARADSKVKSLSELVAFAKANPNEVAYGHGGMGTMGHLSTELFASMAGGLKMRNVAYRGGPPMWSDLLGGQIEFANATPLESIEYQKQGKIRILATTGSQPFRGLPDVPPISKFYPGYSAVTWAGLFVPKGTPPDVQAKLRKAAEAALSKPELKAQLEKFGVTPVSDTSPETFRKSIDSELKRWTGLIKEIGPIPE